jgi:hypothetical protein
MSNDAFGQRGTLSAAAGETVDVDLYVNADHGGFYRYEYANSTNPSNEDFMANPVSPWYSFHASAETVGTYPGRVIGYTKSDTDNYLYDMNRVPGGGLGGDRKNPSSQDPTSSFCQSSFDNCFYRDPVALPAGASGEGVLRLNWFSAETSQIYTNCIDMVVGDGTPQPPGSPTSAPPSPTAAPPAPTPSPGGQCVSHYGQCGGIGWTGDTVCCDGRACEFGNDYYSQCL